MNAVPQPARRPLSVDDYHRMADAAIFGPEERVELIEGEIIAMPPIGPDHASLVDRLNRTFGRAVGDAAIVRVQNPVHLSRFSEPQPDLCLLAPRDDFYAGFHPRPADTLLAIEIAKSSLAYDTTRKAPLYAHEGVQELWIVDVAGRAVRRFRSPGARGYTDAAALGLARPVPLPSLGIEVDLSRLFS